MLLPQHQDTLLLLQQQNALLADENP